MYSKAKTVSFFNDVSCKIVLLNVKHFVNSCVLSFYIKLNIWSYCTWILSDTCIFLQMFLCMSDVCFVCFVLFLVCIIFQKCNNKNGWLLCDDRHVWYVENKGGNWSANIKINKNRTFFVRWKFQLYIDLLTQYMIIIWSCLLFRYRCGK